MDRFERIKSGDADPKVFESDMLWLIAEVERLRFFNKGIGKENDELHIEIERLRRIEDAVIKDRDSHIDFGALWGGLECLSALEANPRPEGE